jgi:predicted enzyme related to lactoylglutathione lyase
MSRSGLSPWPVKAPDRAAEVAVWNHHPDVNRSREGSTPMQMKLELIPLPVSDVDRAIDFYAGKLGFNKDVDVQPTEGVRVVQMTPEGSGCSVGFGTGLDVYAGEPGSVRGLHLVVEDIAETRAELLGRGVEVSDIHDFGGGVRGADFSDPDGNSFELQEMAWRRGAEY